MASYNELLALIDAYINQNGVQAITGQVLNGVLRAMVDQLGRGYSIMGAADPTTDPGTPDGPETWFASVPGTYTNFDGIQIVDGELALLSYEPSTGFSKNTIYEGFQTVQATIDGNVGTPAVGVSYANGILSFDFHNMKGVTGDPAGFGAVTASVDSNIGTPSVQVQTSGPDTAKAIAFQFHNLKGETGVTSVLATVDNTSGNPQCAVSLNGQQLVLNFTGLKGAQGDTGSSVDYPFTIVNNLTTNDPAQALSAAMGVQLESEVSQLEAKVIENDTRVAGVDDGSGNNGSYGKVGLGEYTHPAQSDTKFDYLVVRGVDLGDNASVEFRVYIYRGTPNAYGVPTGTIGANHTLLKSGTITKEGTGAVDYRIDFDTTQTCPTGQMIIVYLVGDTYNLSIDKPVNGLEVDYNYALFSLKTTTEEVWAAQWYDGATTYKARSLFAYAKQTFATVRELNEVKEEIDGEVAEMSLAVSTVETKNSELERKTVTKDILTLGTDDSSVADYSSYQQYGLAQYTQKAEVEISFNRIVIRGLDLLTNASCDFRVYLYSGTVNTYGVPTGYIGENHTLLKSGTIQKQGEGSVDYNIDFEVGQTCPAGSNIIVYLAGAEKIQFVWIASGGSFTYNYQLFTTTSSNIFNAQWYDGATTYRARCLHAYVRQVFATFEDVQDEVREAVPGEMLNITRFDAVLPDEIIAVEGDTLQVYYRGLLDTPNPDVYDVISICSVGKSFPRYFELAVTNDMVGNSYPLEIRVRDGKLNTIASKTATVKVVAKASSPASEKKILCVGDSTTSGGEWPAELKRRLTATSGDDTPANPTGLGLSNITFVGRKEKEGVHFEAAGGVKVQHYATQGERALRFIVSGVTQLYIGDRYTIGNTILNLQEINVTGGSGNIKFTLLSALGTIPASGTITKSSGNGDATIAYSSYTEESYNPFYNENTEQLDFAKYATDWCGGNIDYIVFLVGVNDIVSGADNATTLDYYKTIIRAYLSDFPSGKVLLLSVPAGSPDGGYGANYGASLNRNFYTIARKERDFAEGLMDISEDVEFSGNVVYVPCLEEFDCEYGYPSSSKSANNRSSVTEVVGTNAVHPNPGGYNLIADAVYRTMNDEL